MSTADELIQIVDEQDQPVRLATKQQAWGKGLIHRIARVMVETPDGQVLLQKRQPDMQLYPSCWDDSTAGHVDPGETYEQSAKRELTEEIGLKNVKLKEVGTYYYEGMFEWRKLKRFNKVYKVIVPKDTKFVLAPSEVAEVRWFSITEAKQLVRDHPDQVTDGLVQVIERFY